jgi:hypothetical protein
MRAKLLIAALAGALGVLGGWLIARQPAPPVAEVPPAKAEPPSAKVNRSTDVGKQIPFDSIHCLIPHEGMKSLELSRDPELRNMARQLRVRLENCPYRTAFLVHAPTLYGAVEDALGAFTGHSVLNAIGVRGAQGSDKCWAVLYLGTYLEAIREASLSRNAIFEGRLARFG